MAAGIHQNTNNPHSCRNYGKKSCSIAAMRRYLKSAARSKSVKTREVKRTAKVLLAAEEKGLFTITSGFHTGGFGSESKALAPDARTHVTARLGPKKKGIHVRFDASGRRIIDITG